MYPFMWTLRFAVPSLQTDTQFANKPHNKQKAPVFMARSEDVIGLIHKLKILGRNGRL